MKIRPEHYEHMKAAIAPLMHLVPAHREFVIAEGKARDVEKRIRWDLCYKAGLSSWMSSTLYGYVHDSHIDTALRNIVAELQVAPQVAVEAEAEPAAAPGIR